MQYSFDRFPQITQETKQKLIVVGINTTDELLNVTTLPEQRRKLSLDSGVDEEEITRLAAVSDIVRIKGIGPTWAWYIVNSGIAGNVQQLISQFQPIGIDASMSVSQTRILMGGTSLKVAQDLLVRMKNAIGDESDKTRLPTPKQLIDAVDEAKELRPRLVAAPGPDEIPFDQYLEEDNRISTGFLGTTQAVLTGLIIFTVLSLLSFTYIFVRAEINRQLTEYGYIAHAIAELSLPPMNLMFSGYMALILFLLLFFTALLSFHQLINMRVIQKRLLKFLFDKPGRRATYKKLNSIDHSKRRKFALIALIPLIVMCFVLVTITLRSLTNEVSNDIFQNQVIHIVSLAAIPAVFLISAPSLIFYLKDLKLNHSIEKEGLRDYLIYLATQWLWLFVLVYLFFLILPALLSFHRYLYQTYLLPPFESIITERRQALLDAPIISQYIQDYRTSMLSAYETAFYSNLEYIGCVSQQDVKVYEEFFSAVSSFWIPVGMTGIALLFIIPYLIFGGIKKGILYMLVLFISFNVENILEANSGKWFKVNENSLLYVLVFALGVFTLALFLDWLFESLTDPPKICPNCNAGIDGAADYCPNCGLIQPHHLNPSRTKHYSIRLRNYLEEKISFVTHFIAKTGSSPQVNELSKPLPKSSKPRRIFSSLQSIKPVQWLLIYGIIMIVFPILVWKGSDIYFARTFRPNWLPDEMNLVSSFPVLNVEAPIAMTKSEEILWVLDLHGWVTEIDTNGMNERSFKLLCDSCGGITFDGGAIWYADVKLGYLYQMDISSQHSELKFPLPGKSENVVGLAWDGSYLWVSTQDPYQIFRMDPSDGKVISQIPGPVIQNHVGEPDERLIIDLDWKENVLVAHMWSGHILDVDPETGDVLNQHSYDADKRRLLGIAGDNNYIWVIDFLGRIYQLTLQTGKK